ncbi:hypothetical protein SAMCCGM7_Ch0431 [Sinorhizobium americanum CCGM7]|nr:hypothetical protein SAMCCGM7_Ch0431 [Sinorhizobium americanum CCGM7]
MSNRGAATSLIACNIAVLVESLRALPDIAKTFMNSLSEVQHCPGKETARRKAPDSCPSQVR